VVVIAVMVSGGFRWSGDGVQRCSWLAPRWWDQPWR